MHWSKISWSENKMSIEYWLSVNQNANGDSIKGFIKGTSGFLTVNVFSIHDPAWKYILGKSLVKKVKSAFIQAFHTTRAYPVPALPNNPCFVCVCKYLQLFIPPGCDSSPARDYMYLPSVSLPVAMSTAWLSLFRRPITNIIQSDYSIAILIFSIKVLDGHCPEQ